MKIIHSADWHLGRVFLQMRLLDEQRILLDGLSDWLGQIQPDLFILAGDVFDRAYPGREAIDLFSHFLNRLYTETSCAIVIIAGNHDSGELINFGAMLQNSDRVLVAGTLDKIQGKPLLLRDDEGIVAISALPFADIFTARQYYNDRSLKDVADVLAAQIAEARQSVPQNARWIIAAHSFVQGCSSSESEQSLDRIGGIETVPPSLFEGAHYVALGHLHRKQKIGGFNHIRYSGSLMRYGFDELDKQKTVTVIDMDGAGEVSVNEWPLVPRHDLRIIKGLFDDILEASSDLFGGADKAGFEDYVKIQLLDQHRIPNAMNRLRQVYPNIVQLEWLCSEVLSTEVSGISRQAVLVSKPEDLFERFFTEVTGQGMDTALKKDLKAELGGRHEAN